MYSHTTLLSGPELLYKKLWKLITFLSLLQDTVSIVRVLEGSLAVEVSEA